MKTELRQLSLLFILCILASGKTDLITDGKEVYELLQQIPAQECGYSNSAHGLSYEQFQAWLIEKNDYAHGLHMADWMVPSSEYWFLVDGVYVGNIRLRHNLTPALRSSSGHIGYAIAPAYRKKGYAKLMLQAVLQEARKLSLNEVMLSADKDNIASRKTIEACGGQLEKESDHNVIYWIKL